MGTTSSKTRVTALLVRLAIGMGFHLYAVYQLLISQLMWCMGPPTSPGGQACRYGIEIAPTLAGIAAFSGLAFYCIAIAAWRRSTPPRDAPAKPRRVKAGGERGELSLSMDEGAISEAVAGRVSVLRER